MTEKEKEFYKSIIKSYFFHWNTTDTHNGFIANYPTSNGNMLNVQYACDGNDLYFNIKRNNRIIQRMCFTETNREKLYQLEAYCNTILSVVKCFE